MNIKKISIIIPAYDEEATIETILNKVLSVKLKYEKEIIVVNDGSKDSTPKIVEKLQKKHKNVSLYNKKNGGKGSAIRLGFKKATGDIFIVQDADLEYEPNEYNSLLKPFEKGMKIVYGSRVLKQRKKGKGFFKGKHPNAGLMAYVGGRTVTIFTNLLFGSKLTDEPTCYKCFKKKVLKNIKIKGKDFSWEPEVTAKLLKKGYKIQEIPISYYPRTSDEGKKINWKDGVIALWTLIKYRF